MHSMLWELTVLYITKFRYFYFEKVLEMSRCTAYSGIWQFQLLVNSSTYICKPVLKSKDSPFHFIFVLSIAAYVQSMISINMASSYVDFPYRAAGDHLECYQRQTSAFLMAVVSQLCFAGQEPPEPDAVEHIFSYVIQHVEGVTTVRTQQLTLRDDQMDPSPVLRSFILRLLLKHRY